MNLLNNYFLTSACFAQTPTDGIESSAVSQVVNQTAPVYGWTLSMLVPIVLGAVGYLLIQHGVVKSKGMFAGGVVAVVLAVGFALGFTPGTFESYVLISFCAVATGGGVGFLTAREPVYAALGFATAVLSVCGVLFMQSALFIAAATMIVYAGATIIIFLFVLMFAQQTELQTYDVELNNPLVASAFGAILLATITMCVTSNDAILPVRVDSTRLMSAASLPDSLSSEAGKEASKKLDAIDPKLAICAKANRWTRAIHVHGLSLSRLKLAGTVLLVATIGAIALAQRSTGDTILNETTQNLLCLRWRPFCDRDGWVFDPAIADLDVPVFGNDVVWRERELDCVFRDIIKNYQGQILAVMVLTIAACEAAIALALVVSLYRRKATLDVAAWDDLSETLIPKVIEAPQSLEEPAMEFPKLTPAGLDPLSRPISANFDAQSMENGESVKASTLEGRNTCLVSLLGWFR